MRICKQCKNELDDACFDLKNKFLCLKCLNENRRKASFSICKKCNRTLDRTQFKKNSQYCLECSEIRNNEPIEIPTKVCKNCNKEKRMPDEIYYASFNCRECEKILEEKLEQEKQNKIWKHPCKDCGREFEGSKNKTWFICDDCQKKREEKLIEELSKNICKKCGKEFKKESQSHQRYCDECRNQEEVYISTCEKCGEQKSREFFTLRKFICDDCSEIINAEEYFNRTYRYCGACNEYKTISEEISYKAFFCNACVKERRRARVVAKKKTSWVRICPDCGDEVVTTVPRATIIYCEKCRKIKHDLKRQKIERYMNQKKYDYCQICKQHIKNNIEKNRTIVCLDCRPNMDKFKMLCFKDGKYIKTCIKCNGEFEASAERFWQNICCDDCSKPEGELDYHFGYKGICTDGHKFNSLHEQDFDEWLNEKKIKHIPQFRLIPTYRRSDFYLKDYKVHIEIDGMERQDDVDWYGKLSVYEKLGMKLNKDYLIFKPVSVHFKSDKANCFQQMDSLVLPLLGVK